MNGNFFLDDDQIKKALFENLIKKSTENFTLLLK